ncbi:MAG: hypothetical protein KA175_06495 [Flavobacteriales bacterium]|nr:hypothetical protein [Flavobacteriales bacterium]
MKQLFLSIALATACLSTAPMAAQDKTNAAKTGGDHTDQGLEGLTDQLGLTGEQNAQVNAIHKDFAKKAKDLKALGLPKEEQRPKMKVLKDERDAALKKVLNPAQWTRLEALREERKAAKKAEKDDQKNKTRPPHQE